MYTITTRFCSVLLIQGNIPIEQHKQSLSWGCAAAIIPSTSLGAIQGVSGYAASIVPLTDYRGKSKCGCTVSSKDWSSSLSAEAGGSCLPGKNKKIECEKYKKVQEQYGSYTSTGLQIISKGIPQSPALFIYAVWMEFL